MQLLSKDMDWKMESVLDTLFRKEKFCVCIVTHSIKTCVCGFPLRVAQEFFNRPSSLVEFPNVSSFFGRFFPVPFLCLFLNLWTCGICAAILGPAGRLVPWLISMSGHLCLQSVEFWEILGVLSASLQQSFLQPSFK